MGRGMQDLQNLNTLGDSYVAIFLGESGHTRQAGCCQVTNCRELMNPLIFWYHWSRNIVCYHNKCKQSCWQRQLSCGYTKATHCSTKDHRSVRSTKVFTLTIGQGEAIGLTGHITTAILLRWCSQLVTY